MPCWYFEKRELRNTPSFKDGIDSGTENRYRREGARFIIDAGTKMNLYPCNQLHVFVIGIGKIENQDDHLKYIFFI